MKRILNCGGVPRPLDRMLRVANCTAYGFLINECKPVEPNHDWQHDGKVNDCAISGRSGRCSQVMAAAKSTENSMPPPSDRAVRAPVEPPNLLRPNRESMSASMKCSL
jgi:hypothetical protein